MRSQGRKGEDPASKPAGDFDAREYVETKFVGRVLLGLGIAGSIASIVGVVVPGIRIIRQVADPWAIATLVASILLAATIAFGVYQRRALTDVRLRWLRSADPTIIYSMMAKAIGMTRDQYTKIVTIHETGAADLEFGFTIRAVTRQVHWVEQKATLPDHFNANAASEVSLTGGHDEKHIVRPERVGPPGGRTALYRLHIEPCLQTGESTRLEGIRMTEPAGTFAQSKRDMRGNNEYTAVMTQYPCDELRLEVRFDAGTAPGAGDVGYDVWFGEAKMPHAEEHRRIQEIGAFEFHPRAGQSATAVLRVPYPLPELRYAVVWFPNR